jgi:peptidoglycan/LPS O-acetylase OafA/YrhL
MARKNSSRRRNSHELSAGFPAVELRKYSTKMKLGNVMKLKDATPTDSHWAILATLRFFLAVVVVLGHFSLYIRSDPFGIVGGGYLNPLSAVYGFFILSGYSIAASLDKGATGFVRRRFIRIWPLYLAAIAFALAVYLLIPSGFVWPLHEVESGKPAMLSIIASLLMLQTVIASPIGIAGQLWSLAPEWWHYMVSPLLTKISARFLLVPILASFVLFLFATPPGPGVPFPQGQVVLTLSWLWVVGFVYYRFRGTPRGILLLIAPAIFALTIGHDVGVPYFIAAFVLIAADEFSIPQSVRKICNLLGDWSYSLYLFHFACFVVMLHFGSNRSIITLSGAFVISFLALYAVDYPSRKIFRRNARPSMPRDEFASLERYVRSTDDKRSRDDSGVRRESCDTPGRISVRGPNG